MRQDRHPSLLSPVSHPHEVHGLPAALRRYLEHLAVKGYTAQGRGNVERYVRDFIVWAEARSVTHPQNVTRSVLEHYQRWLYYYRKKMGKGNKDRIIPLGERALYWVGRYLEQGRPQFAWNTQELTLFLGAYGEALSPTWLSTTIAQNVERAEIGKHGGVTCSGTRWRR